MTLLRNARPEHAGRASISRRLEELGVVAVIRLKDPARLQHVVDALAAGGVRALEVTITVPGCRRSDPRARPDHARGLPVGCRHDDETFDVGEDTATAVGPYEAPCPFAGTIEKIELRPR